MINTLLTIGKYINNALTTDSTLTSMIGEKKVYPLIADNDVKFPFLVYKRLSLQSNTTKDGRHEDEVVVEISIVSEKYSDGVNIANEVRRILEKDEVSYSDIFINEANLILASEEYSGNSFLQTMQFQMKVNN